MGMEWNGGKGKGKGKKREKGEKEREMKKKGSTKYRNLERTHI